MTQITIVLKVLSLAAFSIGSIGAAPATRSTDATLKGQVKTADGIPIAGAVVTMTAAWTNSPKPLPDPQPTTRTDDHGQFSFPVDSKTAALDFKVEAPGLATNVFPQCEPAKGPHDLRLGKGATVIGRMLSDGRPATGVKVVMRRKYVHQSRGFGFPILTLETITDPQGKFTFEHVARPGDWALQGEDLGPNHAMDVEQIRVDGENTLTDAGDLVIQPALVLSGKIVLSDGKTLPEQSRVYVSRQRTAVDPTGRFSIGGWLPGEITVSPGVKGYRLSHDNRSVDSEGRMLVGTIDRDISDLTILLEPGDPPKPHAMPRLSLDSKTPATRPSRIEGVPPR